MNTNSPSSDALASDSPDLSRLQTLFQQCSPQSHGWSRLEDNERVRFCRWTGQSADGRKHQSNLPSGTRVFPFEGASDSRIPAADEVVRELSDLCVEAFSRAILTIAGNPAAEQSGQAARATKLFNWLRNGPLKPRLLTEADLLASHGLTYGSVVHQVGWERTLGFKMYEFDLNKLMAMAQQAAPDSPLAHFPLLIADPNLEAEAVAVLKQLHQAYALAQRPGNADYDIAELSNKRARRAVRELREAGTCELPLPYLCANQPRLRTRKLWEDCFIPDSADDVQDAPAIFVLDYYNEAQLRALASANEWDDTWVEQAVKLKGFQCEWARRQQTEQTLLEDSATWVQNDRSEFIEVITAYEKVVDEDGVMLVQETVYHGNITGAKARPLVAKHGPTEYPIGTLYPFIGWTSERTQRAFTCARGVPPVMATWQQNLKVCEDASLDRMTMETMPPIKVPSIMGVNYTFAPGGQVPVRPGAMEPEAMNIVGPGGKTAEFLMDRIERRIDRYYGRARPDEPPQNALIKQQKLVRSFLQAGSELLGLCFKLCVNHLPPETIAAITGSEEPLAVEDIDSTYQLHFNVQELDPDFMQARIKAVSEIAATDPSGATDQAAVVRWKYRTIDPSLETQLTTDVQGASGAIYKQVKDDLMGMYLGVPPELRENDPTAPQQLQFAQQIIGTSPEMQQKLQQDERFRNWMELWQKSKQQSIDQQANVQTGKVGVDVRQFQPGGAGMEQAA